MVLSQFLDLILRDSEMVQPFFGDLLARAGAHRLLHIIARYIRK